MIHSLKLMAALTVTLLMAVPVMAQVEVGDVVELDMVSIDGTQITSESTAGKLVVIDFWATWCAPCISFMPHLEAFYEEHHERGVEMIGFSVDEDLQAVRDFQEARQLPWNIVCSGDGWEDQTVASLLEYRAVPQLIVLSPEGEVLFAGVAHGEIISVLEGLVEAHLGEQAQADRE